MIDLALSCTIWQDIFYKSLNTDLFFIRNIVYFTTGLELHNMARYILPNIKCRPSLIFIREHCIQLAQYTAIYRLVPDPKLRY